MNRGHIWGDFGTSDDCLDSEVILYFITLQIAKFGFNLQIVLVFRT